MRISRKVTLSQIEAFCILAKTRSFKKSAESLSITQPSLINKISSLEEVYNTKLFVRSRENNRLTPLGESLLPLFKAALNQVKDAEFMLMASDKMQYGEVHLAAVSPYLISEVLKCLHRKCPNIKVKVTYSSSEVIKAMLLRGDVDAGFFVQNDKLLGYQVIPHFKYRIQAIVPKDHPLSVEKKIDISAFAGQKIIVRESGSLTRQQLEKAANENNIKLDIAYELGSREAVRDAVGHSMGISVVANHEHVEHKNIHTVAINEASFEIQSHLVISNERLSSPFIKLLMEVVSL
ncbi:LysR family transcriptional regulator [Thalassomonas viridans]|uniref:LysR family transcriptional regulator n=1 Tax=Thalassomonas viridans TaxID=137584 RepID=A0AAE9Z5J9_9GAMM|nr:LysR substrate-binding domain-containing protein [Thalassomonas viridans]WDE05648.1 LysR family transcriptional regulator [Thalassomonas viridans]